MGRDPRGNAQKALQDLRNFECLGWNIGRRGLYRGEPRNRRRRHRGERAQDR